MASIKKKGAHLDDEFTIQMHKQKVNKQAMFTQVLALKADRESKSVFKIKKKLKPKP